MNMGNDGGSIPTRRELVKNAARNPNTSEVKASQLESQTHAWTYCPLSQRPLSAPMVSDCVGILYNKDAVIEYLLPKDDPPNATKTEYEEVLAERIKSLRDVVEVKFQTEKGASNKAEKCICPITSKELGAHTKAVYVVPCGHAFSETAIKEVASDICLYCNESYDTENVIPILPVAREDIARMTERIQRLKDQGLTHSLKKLSLSGGKKRKKNTTAGSTETAKRPNDVGRARNPVTERDKTLPTTRDTDVLPKNGTASMPQSSTTSLVGIKNAATASLTARVLDEQDEKNKRRKLGLNDNLKSLFSKAGSNGSAQKGDDFMTRGYSIPKEA